MRRKTDIEKAATGVANEFVLNFPPALLAAASGSAGESEKVRQRQEVALRKLVGDVERYQKTARLGVFKKVLFARAFQRQLKGLGFPGHFIRTVTSRALAAIAFASVDDRT